MSALRGHRGAKSRFVAIAVTLCLIVTVFYLHRVKVQHLDELHKCETDHKAVHAQLKAIVEYKERMEHSLSAEKSQHADSVATLRQQLKEHDQLSYQIESLQTRYNNVTKQCDRIKESLESQKETLNRCQNDIDQAAVEKNKYEAKIAELSSLVTKYQTENGILQKQLKTIADVKTNGGIKLVAHSTNAEDKNFSRQIKTSKDSYYVPNSSKNKTKDVDNNRNVYHVLNVQQSQQIPQPNETNPKTPEPKFNMKKPDMPHGVPPELPVDENMNEKNMNFLMKSAQSENAEVKRPDGNPPNRYKVKLMQDVKDAAEPVNFEANKKAVDVQLESANDKINQNEVGDEKSDKKADPDDSNISQNNGEAINNNEIREDDDDMDEYGYPRVEAAEDPGQ